MWCCVGSGMENHGKYGQFIYTHTQDALYLNLFIPSELTWKEKGITLKQLTTFPYEDQTKLEITKGSARFALKVRYPQWVSKGNLKVLVNGKPMEIDAQPSSYITINRVWKKGDVIQVTMPMQNTIEHLPYVPNYVAFMHGPILLGARTGVENLSGLVAGDSRWGHIAAGQKLPVNKAPIIIEDDISKLGSKLTPVAGQALTFKISGVKMLNSGDVTLEPFYKIHDARYMMYWMGLSNKQYKSYLDSIGKIEEQNLALQKRTIDFVAPGEQQPEADHFIQKQNSNTGNFLDQFWRDARNSGYFSYSLSTNKETNLSLIVRYWGAETGNRNFAIYINDEKLSSENISGKWNQQKFQEVEYQIPESMLKGKEKINVKFQADQANTAGPVYYLRLARK